MSQRMVQNLKLLLHFTKSPKRDYGYNLSLSMLKEQNNYYVTVFKNILIELLKNKNG